MGEKNLLDVRCHALQTGELGEVRCCVFGIPDQSPVTAVVVGDLTDAEAPLVRIHSRCSYAEVFGSVDCDCRDQRDLSFRLIRGEGVGIFIYLEQEGRDAGLLRKADSYVLRQTEGLDTVAAYERLGLDPDSRRYVVAAEVLHWLGVSRVRLLTNNPRKVADLAANGISVEQVYLRTKPNVHNLGYLRTKQRKLGHRLGLKRGTGPDVVDSEFEA
jgi:3,4-dihydroxy 2-butanone 4-phosphate synthase/GTP cyclohydrolase II